MALMLGLFLGQIVALMAQRESAGWAGFGISTVLVAAASASFVLGVLGLQQQRQPVSAPMLTRQARGLAIVIGLGLLLSLSVVAA
jgi:dipeptide/tripeptide permease